MEENIFVKPKSGFTIRDPYARDHIPAEGRLVTRSPYWTRLINDGDVIVAPNPDAEAVRPAAKPTAK